MQATSKVTSSTRWCDRAWEETSMLTTVTPSLSISERSWWISGESGVVLAAGNMRSFILLDRVPINPVRKPA